MFDCKRSEISKVIYHNVLKTEIHGKDREKVKMMVDIYESGNDFRTDTDSNTNRQQPLQSTVCLVLLCVLLLTAVIVLCVLINTNNQQCHKSKNLTEETDQLLTKYTNIAEERDELIAKYNNITKLSEQWNQKINKLWTCLCDGWIYYQFSLYFISSEKKSWSESRRDCRERGADLIIINNKEEQDFIKKIIGGDRLWIGLSDSDEEGRWKWVDKSTLSYSFWASGEPNGKREENCVESHSSGWNDISCNIARKWICEKQ